MSLPNRTAGVTPPRADISATGLAIGQGERPPNSGPSALREAARRGPRVFTYRNGKFLYWSLARKPSAVFHVARVLPRFIASAARFITAIKWSRDRRPVMVIALLEYIGDIVAAEPIARLARETHPGHRVIWITRKVNKALVETYAPIDRVMTVGCLTEWMLLWRLGLTDVVWDLHVNDRICNDCGVPQRKRDGLPGLDNYYQFGSLLEVQCLCAGLPRLAAGPRIEPPTEARTRVDSLRLPGRFVAIHCRASDPRRDWPVDRWRLLVAAILKRRDIEVVEVGIRPLVASDGAARLHNLCDALSLLETAEVIRRADLFIGIDSGPAHLANAVGTPGIILLGDYVNFKHYMPYSGGYRDGTNADILYAEGTVVELEVETVLTALAKRLRR